MVLHQVSEIYRFKRLPYGIHSGSQVFQKEVTSIISDVPDSANSQNDFLVWEENLQEQDERLRKVFLKIRESGLKLNKTKCQIEKHFNYLEKFISNLAEHTTPLRNLLKKDVVFELQNPQLDAIENLKTLATSAPCLKIFD